MSIFLNEYGLYYSIMLYTFYLDSYDCIGLSAETLYQVHIQLLKDTVFWCSWVTTNFQK